LQARGPTLRKGGGRKTRVKNVKIEGIKQGEKR
jgi:hypothetical protein